MTHPRTIVTKSIAALRALCVVTPESVGAAFGHALALSREDPYLRVHAVEPASGPFERVALLAPAPGARHAHTRVIVDLARDVDVTRDDVTEVAGTGTFSSEVLDAPGGEESWWYTADSGALLATYSRVDGRLRSICLALGV